MFILGRQKIGFVFHFSYLAYRISYFVGARNRRRTQRAPNIGGGCAFDAKKGLSLGLPMFVSRFQQASKKNFGFWDFWFQVCAHLIEILRLSGYFIQLLRYTAGARCSMYYKYDSARLRLQAYLWHELYLE